MLLLNATHYRVEIVLHFLHINILCMLVFDIIVMSVVVLDVMHEIHAVVDAICRSIDVRFVDDVSRAWESMCWKDFFYVGYGIDAIETYIFLRELAIDALSVIRHVVCIYHVFVEILFDILLRSISEPLGVDDVIPPNFYCRCLMYRVGAQIHFNVVPALGQQPCQINHFYNELERSQRHFLLHTKKCLSTCREKLT